MPNANEKKSTNLEAELAESRANHVRIIQAICNYCRGKPELREEAERLAEMYLSEAYLATTNEPRLNASQKQTGDVPATSNSTS